MAKNAEALEVDEFLLDEQNNNIEDQLIEEEEDESEETSLRFRVRPARASLTHNAIKSELLKMNKQNQQDSNEDADENLSRSARKRKKRKEKILEERRQSGGRQFEDDLDHFKSIPISRRRSSVLPFTSTVALPNHNNNDSGFCSQLKCIFWVLLVVGTLIGLIMIWPTVAEVDLAEPVINQDSDENLQPEVEQSNHNEQLNEQADQILNQVDKLSKELGNEEDNQEEANPNEESLGAFSYITNFFATEDAPAEQTATEQDNEQVNENEEANNEDVNETPITPESMAENNDNTDEGFEEANEIAVEENLADSVPERYQSVVNHDLEETDDENQESQQCIIGGQIYDNLDETQCGVLQERHRDLERKLREQEDLIRYQQQQEQQQEQSEINNDEQFYFF